MPPFSQPAGPDSTVAMPTASATLTSTHSPPTVSSTSSTLLPLSHPSNGPSSKSLGIGLGIGLPLGIVLLALLFLHYRELRKHNRQSQSGANETTLSQHPARLEPGVVQTPQNPWKELPLQALAHELPERAG